MSTIAIAGGSGVVGQRALRHVLARQDVDRVIAVGRRKLPLEDVKLVCEIADLSSKTAIAGALPDGINAALCCLGTTIKQAGSKDAFRAVDRDAVVAFAEAALQRGARRFLLVSSIGANSRSGNFYLRTKGETEEAVAGLGFSQLTILRPSFIDDEGARGEFRLAERLLLPFLRPFFSVFARNSRYAPITADIIGRAMARLALDGTSGPVQALEGRQLRAAGSETITG